MLEYIRIQRFKTLMDARFPLSRLNIFTGQNGMGKSTILQVLLLLRQSFEKGVLLNRGLMLKGDYVSLGTGQDVLAEQTDDETIEFLLKWSNDPPHTFKYDYKVDNELQPLCNKNDNLQILDTVLRLGKHSLFNHQFQYLATDRVNPKTSYEISDYYVNERNSLGIHGEYAVHYIAQNSSKSISLKNLKHTKAKTDSLLENIDCWMSEITPGIRIHASLQRQLNSVSLCYAFSQGKNMTADFKPQNVGFGITYVLPVITALLRAQSGDLLIIENPESHLHPAGQSLIGRMCALAAEENVQLFIESHSDHFFNGIRVAVKEQVINKDNVRFFYLERNASDLHASDVISPKIDDNGHLSCWPSGFFDESDKLLEKLL